jgi:16S rRNA processing protein RimM
MPPRRVTLAAIAGAHGVTGEVRLKLFAESLESFARHTAFEANGRALTLKSVKAAGKGHIARFAEITDRTAAEALRGAELTVPRTALPPAEEGEIYIADLVGLDVVTTDGRAVGKIIGVENFGAGDILAIAREDGGEFMVPFNRAAVPEVGAVLTLDPEFLP